MVDIRFQFYLKICSGTSKKMLQNMCQDKNDKSRCTSNFFIITFVIPTEKVFVDAKTTGSILGFKGMISTFIWESYFFFFGHGRGFRRPSSKGRSVFCPFSINYLTFLTFFFQQKKYLPRHPPASYGVVCYPGCVSGQPSAVKFSKKFETSPNSQHHVTDFHAETASYHDPPTCN